MPRGSKRREHAVDVAAGTVGRVDRNLATLLLPAPFGPTIVVSRLVRGKENPSNDRSLVPDSDVRCTAGIIHHPSGGSRR